LQVIVDIVVVCHDLNIIVGWFGTGKDKRRKKRKEKENKSMKYVLDNQTKYCLLTTNGTKKRTS